MYHPLQVISIHYKPRSKSRLVVDEDDNGKFGLEMAKVNKVGRLGPNTFVVQCMLIIIKIYNDVRYVQVYKDIKGYTMCFFRFSFHPAINVQV